MANCHEFGKFINILPIPPRGLSEIACIPEEDAAVMRSKTNITEMPENFILVG